MFYVPAFNTNLSANKKMSDYTLKSGKNYKNNLNSG